MRTSVFVKWFFEVLRYNTKKPSFLAGTYAWKPHRKAFVRQNPDPGKQVCWPLMNFLLLYFFPPDLFYFFYELSSYLCRHFSMSLENITDVWWSPESEMALSGRVEWAKCEAMRSGPFLCTCNLIWEHGAFYQDWNLMLPKHGNHVLIISE